MACARRTAQNDTLWPSAPRIALLYCPLKKSALREEGIFANIVNMTRNTKRNIVKPAKGRSRSRRPAKKDCWPLQDAKARFSELVRRVHSEGPQHVTVHGRDEVVIVAADEFRRMKGNLTGQLLIDAMQASPHRDIDIEPRREPMPVRDVNL